MLAEAKTGADTPPGHSGYADSLSESFQRTSDNRPPNQGNHLIEDKLSWVVGTLERRVSASYSSPPTDALDHRSASSYPRSKPSLGEGEPRDARALAGA